ncbi:MAG: molybdenum ABC transporter ATP-binding protein [Bryobacterales bacterium]|nr:molybdenum ABC transporter ATP-binding protein [Bryobacterales bacterium]
MSAELLSLQVQLSFPGFDLDVAEELRLDGVTALFGPSGGGKSTLLRTIAGLETPRTGRIALGGEIWFDSEARVNVPAHRRPVGFMFQDARLFGHLGVAGNLAFADKRSRTRAAGFNRGDVIAALDLRPLLDRSIGSLSGGERQRVALARTLLTRPKLLLLDEPLSALDLERKADILPYLEDLPKRFGIPTIYVSHALEEVVRLADRVLVLTDGRPQAYGPAAAIVERLDLQPITGRFEAGVLVEARVTGQDERLALTHLDLDGETLKMPMVGHLKPGDTIRLRIRARDVALATRRPEGISIRNVLSGIVDDIAPETDTAFAEVYVALKTTRFRARLTRAAVEDLGLTKGTPVFALIKSVTFDRRLI